MQFFSWKAFEPVGQPLVDPKWIAWDPDVTVAALAYADGISLCRTRPSFKAFASLPIEVAIVVAQAWPSCMARDLPGFQVQDTWLHPMKGSQIICEVCVQCRPGVSTEGLIPPCDQNTGTWGKAPCSCPGCRSRCLGPQSRCTECHELSSSRSSLQSFCCTFYVLAGVSIDQLS